jgi:hypothetical protein
VRCLGLLPESEGVQRPSEVWLVDDLLLAPLALVVFGEAVVFWGLSVLLPRLHLKWLTVSPGRQQERREKPGVAGKNQNKGEGGHKSV